MADFIERLESEFRRHANPEIAAGQRAYMKNRFEFYGIQTPLRRKIQKPFFIRKQLPPKTHLEQIVKTLWEKPQREYQYFAQELTQKYTGQFGEKDIGLFEYMITHKSWWDTVDLVASHLVAAYFKIYPQERNGFVDKWIASENIWLQRTALLFQLNYKDELDKECLAYCIRSLCGSDEFFINKAIGWVLRQYSKTNPAWVIDFANKTPLHQLSRKEALRLMK